MWAVRRRTRRGRRGGRRPACARTAGKAQPPFPTDRGHQEEASAPLDTASRLARTPRSLERRVPPTTYRGAGRRSPVRVSGVKEFNRVTDILVEDETMTEVEDVLRRLAGRRDRKSVV